MEEVSHSFITVTMVMKWKHQWELPEESESLLIQVLELPEGNEELYVYHISKDVCNMLRMNKKKITTFIFLVN